MLGSCSSDEASNNGWSKEADSVRISRRAPGLDAGADWEDAWVFSSLGGDQGTKGARVMTGVFKPRTLSGWVSSRGGCMTGTDDAVVSRYPRGFWRGIEKLSGVWDRVLGQLLSVWLSSKTESSRQFSPHGASLGSGVDALTMTDPHRCRFKSSSAWRTDICFAKALSRKLWPLLSEGAVAERFLLVLLSIRIDCSRLWFSTLLELHLVSITVHGHSRGFLIFVT